MGTEGSMEDSALKGKLCGFKCATLLKRLQVLAGQQCLLALLTGKDRGRAGMRVLVFNLYGVNEPESPTLFSAASAKTLRVNVQTCMWIRISIASEFA